MSIRQQIRSWIGRGRTFECVGCGRSVEEVRLSCPTCGWCLREV